MPDCSHLDRIRDIQPRTPDGCEECLRSGDWWVHLRMCMTCGHVGCCDSSPNKHASKHFEAAGHPIVKAYDPPQDWLWCYADSVKMDME